MPQTRSATPTATRRAGRPPGGGGQAKVLTPRDIADVDPVLAGTPHERRTRAMLFLQLATGLRAKELASLDVGDVFDPYRHDPKTPRALVAGDHAAVSGRHCACAGRGGEGRGVLSAERAMIARDLQRAPGMLTRKRTTPDSDDGACEDHVNVDISDRPEPC
jgi:hypothetical protein